MYYNNNIFAYKVVVVSSIMSRLALKRHKLSVNMISLQVGLSLDCHQYVHYLTAIREMCNMSVWMQNIRAVQVPANTRAMDDLYQKGKA